MTTQVKEATVKPKKTYLPDAQVKESIGNSIIFCLNSSHLAESNVNYIQRMWEKHHTDKRLTPNEVAGLAKIERALKRVANGTYKVETV